VAADHSDDHLVQVATRIYDWYVDPTDDQDVLNRIVRVNDMRSLIHVVSNVNDALFLRRTFHSENFASQRHALISKWSPAFDGRRKISIETAREFLRFWMSNTDHRLLYSHGMVAGMTHSERSVPASDFVTSYHANRDAWTLHLTSRGAASYSAGVTIDARRGDLMLIAPDASAHYGRHRGSDEWLHYWALFQPRPDWDELMQWPLRSFGIRKLGVRNEADIIHIESLFEQMIDTCDNSSPMLDRLLVNLLEQVLIRAQHYSEVTKVRLTDPRILKASDYMLRNLKEMRSVAEVAEACNLSESRLAHLFQQYVGMGVRKYCNSLRLQRAKNLLATTSIPISVVAREVGWNDPAHFSRFFVRNIGCSPKQFRTTFAGTLVDREVFPENIEAIGD